MKLQKQMLLGLAALVMSAVPMLSSAQEEPAGPSPSPAVEQPVTPVAPETAPEVPVDNNCGCQKPRCCHVHRCCPKPHCCPKPCCPPVKKCCE